MPDNRDSDFYLTPTESESIESLVSDLSGIARESLDGETFNQLDEYRLAREAQDLPSLGRSTLGAFAKQLEKSGDGTVTRNEFGDVTELFFQNAFEECVKVGIDKKEGEVKINDTSPAVLRQLAVDEIMDNFETGLFMQGRQLSSIQAISLTRLYRGILEKDTPAISDAARRILNDNPERVMDQLKKVLHFTCPVEIEHDKDGAPVLLLHGRIHDVRFGADGVASAVSKYGVRESHSQSDTTDKVITEAAEQAISSARHMKDYVREYDNQVRPRTYIAK